jgi:hypothetical protein
VRLLLSTHPTDKHRNIINQRIFFIYRLPTL